MESATLDDLLTWNDQLAALAQAGVPVDVGLASAEANFSAALQQINTIVARRVSQGVSLIDALDDNAVPAGYRSRVQLGLKSGDLSGTLARSCVLGDSLHESGQALKSGLLYPFLVCVIAYVGLIMMCLVFVPTISRLHASLAHPPGAALRMVQMLRDALPYWVGLPPLALMIGIVWKWSTTAGRRASTGGSYQNHLSLPGLARSIRLHRCADFSAALATLLDRNVAFEESLRIAAGVSGDSGLQAGAESLIDSLKTNSMPGDKSLAALRFPPFLRWAVWHSEATIGRTCALRTAAGIYRDRACRDADRWRVVAPVVACVVLGGGVTLAYGLTLFLPVVELLTQLAS